MNEITWEKPFDEEFCNSTVYGNLVFTNIHHAPLVKDFIRKIESSARKEALSRAIEVLPKIPYAYQQSDYERGQDDYRTRILSALQKELEANK